MIEAVLFYMAGFIAMLLFAAIRTPHNELRPVTVICALWPAMLPLILFSMLMDVVGWTLDFDTVNKPFGYRMSPNPAVKGVAVTVLFMEFRLFKMRSV
jgi:hypothetical protein